MIRIVVLLIVCCFTFSAEASEADFAKANSFYESGKYKEALELYKTIEPENRDWKVYYNMGNSSFKLKQYLEAKISYLKAEMLNPVNEDIKFNIRITNRYFKDKIPEEKVDFISGVVRKINTYISINTVSYLLIFFIILLNISVILFLYRKMNKRLFAYVGTIFFLCVSFLLIFHIYRVGLENAKAVGVVIKDSVSLYSGPGSENTALFEVNSGLKLKISGESSDWYQVSASKDIAGWISADDMVKL